MNFINCFNIFEKSLYSLFVVKLANPESKVMGVSENPESLVSQRHAPQSLRLDWETRGRDEIADASTEKECLR